MALTLVAAAPIFFLTGTPGMASTSPFGEHLKREREMRGVSLEEVSSATRISTKFLEAIESGHWEQLPGGAFNRGFIRSTSRYLGLDEDGMVAEYALETKTNGHNGHAVPVYVGKIDRDWKRIGATVAVLLLLLATGGFVASRIIARWRTHVSAITPASVAGSEAASKTSSAVSAPLDLIVRASNPTELRVVADGKPIFDGSIQSREEKHFVARARFEVSVTNPAAIALELNGQLLPRLASTEQPGRITLTAKDLKFSAGGVH